MASGSNVVISVLQFSWESDCYRIWVVKMKSCLKSFGLWDYVDEDKHVQPLQANPTVAQMKHHEEEKLKKEKAVSVLHSTLADDVFTRIMHLETAKQIWDELNEGMLVMKG